MEYFVINLKEESMPNSAHDEQFWSPRPSAWTGSHGPGEARSRRGRRGSQTEGPGHGHDRGLTASEARLVYRGLGAECPGPRAPAAAAFYHPMMIDLFPCVLVCCTGNHQVMIPFTGKPELCSTSICMMIFNLYDDTTD
jgi:hypothetical protein